MCMGLNEPKNKPIFIFRIGAKYGTQLVFMLINNNAAIILLEIHLPAYVLLQMCRPIDH